MIISTTVKIENHPYSKEFLSLFNVLSRNYDKRQVWNDFVVMAACTISNAWDKRFYTVREERYVEIASKYTKDEQDDFAKLLAYVTLSLTDKTEQDFLGAMYTLLGLNDKDIRKLYPYDVSALLAHIPYADNKKETTEEHSFKVWDERCGSGTNLIKFANEARRNNINSQRRITFVAQDSDTIAGLMCYIQLSILDCKLVLKMGDTPTDIITDEDMESESVWLSPMYTHEKLFRKLDALKRAKELLTYTPVKSEDNDEEETA